MSGKKIFVIFIFVTVLILGIVVHEVIGMGLAKLPVDLEKVSEEDRDKEILRIGIMAELDAVNLYEQLAASAVDPHLKKVLMDIAVEEKTHIGEFQALLLKMDKEQEEELKEGQKEIKELLDGEND